MVLLLIHQENILLKHLRKENLLLTATSIGYRPFEQTIKLEGKGILTIDIVLKEEITELTAVVISAGTFEASDRKRAAAVLTPIDIVTTASANGDITGALKTLPGAQQVGESEGLFVRAVQQLKQKSLLMAHWSIIFFTAVLPTLQGMEDFLHLFLKELFSVQVVIQHYMARHFFCIDT